MYNNTRPNYVRNCAFNHGYSPAIGIVLTGGIPIENNVIYHTIDMGLTVAGHSNIIRNNLVALNYWPGTFVPWQAEFLLDYFGAIDVRNSQSVILENNYVAGSERVGIHYRGDVCYNEMPSPMKHSIQNNIVVGTLAGVAILPIWGYTQFNCSKISKFTIFKSVHYGIYYQNKPSVIVDSNILVDNQINVLLKVIDPPVLEHIISRKTMVVKNSLIVGKTDSFDCLNDIYPENVNTKWAKTIRAYFAGNLPENSPRGKVGVSWADFSSGSNGAPYKPWYFFFNLNYKNYSKHSLYIYMHL
jgi:hypothetical protein